MGVRGYAAPRSGQHTRSVAFCGLSVALMAICAWITLPFGPVPVTLQTFAIVFVLLLLSPKEAMASLLLYIAMGAIGLPVFSSMRGGISVLAGPTGGFIWGFVLGALLALALLRLLPKKEGKTSFAAQLVAAFAFLLVSYACGTVQLMLISNMGLMAAFLAAVAPFVIFDAVKLVFAVVVSRAVGKSLGI